MSALKQKHPETRDLVVGLGATGLSIARYLKRCGRDACFVDTREAPPGVDELRALWPDAPLELGDIELPADVGRVIASPGVADSHPVFSAARAAGIAVVSDIEVFAREARAPFVAVTGSNGKSTVTTLIERMAAASGRRVIAGGNLGRPALDLLEDEAPDWYVLELSSFQLQRTDALGAGVAVLLNITPDHIDWHGSENDYRQAKFRIFDNASAAVVNRAEPGHAAEAVGVASVRSFGLDAPSGGDYGLVTVDDADWLTRGNDRLLDAADLTLVGRHNQANALAALAACELMGVEMAPALAALRDFEGLPHRMQRIARANGVDYVNDSKATNVAAAAASIASIDGPLLLIAGGEGKGGDFSPLREAVAGKLKLAVLIGTDGPKIAAALGDEANVVTADSMAAAVAAAADAAAIGDTVLLAPACASFDMFDNYMARGDAFARAVRERVA